MPIWQEQWRKTGSKIKLILGVKKSFSFCIAGERRAELMEEGGIPAVVNDEEMRADLRKQLEFPEENHRGPFLLYSSLTEQVTNRNDNI